MVAADTYVKCGLSIINEHCCCLNSPGSHHVNLALLLCKFGVRQEHVDRIIR